MGLATRIFALVSVPMQTKQQCQASFQAGSRVGSVGHAIVESLGFPSAHRSSVRGVSVVHVTTQKLYLPSDQFMIKVVFLAKRTKVKALQDSIVKALTEPGKEVIKKTVPADKVVVIVWRAISARPSW